MLLKDCASIVTQDKERRILNGFDILIEEGKIKKPEHKGCEKIDCQGKIALPSFINCHTHLPMVLLRGYKDDFDLHTWLSEVWKVEAKLRDAEYYAGTKFALIELIKSSTSAYLDMYFGAEAMAEATYQAGLRGYLGFAAMDFEDGEKMHNGLGDIKKSISSVQKQKSALVSPVVSPHACYTCSGKILQEAKKIADEKNLLFTIHLAETRKEVYDCYKKHGKRPVEFLDKLGVIDENFVGFHSSWLTKGEIAILGKRKASVVHCPSSNMKLATGGAFPYKELKEAGITIGLGTDGACSNNSLNILGEMKTAALMQKWFRWNAQEMTAQEALDMATINDAKILRLNSGSIEVGKNADIVLMDKDHYSLLPSQNIVSNIVYSASREAITDLIVNGKIIMENRKILTIDEEKVRDEFERVSDRLLKEGENKNG